MPSKYEQASTFWQIWDKGVKQGAIPGKEKAAREWFRNEAKKIRLNDDTGMGIYVPERQMVRKQILPGFMYQFAYDAKTKDKLPYWDRCPLVFPYKIEADRFHAINLHYLNRAMRARLMDALHSIAINKKYNDNQRLALSYKILESSARFRWFEPCVHTYLFSHVRSKFYKVNGEYWDIALFLPTERFVKASKTQVWNESAKKIAKTRTTKWGMKR